MAKQKAIEFIDPDTGAEIELTLGFSKKQIQTVEEQNINQSREKKQKQLAHSPAMHSNENLVYDYGALMMPSENKFTVAEQLQAFASMSFMVAKGRGKQQKFVTGFQGKDINNETYIVCTCHGMVFTTNTEFEKHAVE